VTFVTTEVGGWSNEPEQQADCDPTSMFSSVVSQTCVTGSKEAAASPRTHSRSRQPQADRGPVREPTERSSGANWRADTGAYGDLPSALAVPTGTARYRVQGAERTGCLSWIPADSRAASRPPLPLASCPTLNHQDAVGMSVRETGTRYSIHGRAGFRSQSTAIRPSV
jgi:hypothetical protein